jgi:pyridoxal phosphate enzyme (YggS family)
MSSIAERLRQIQNEIAQAATRVGRDPNDIRLIAVSKTHSPERVLEAYAAGQRDFGESYVQELLQKAPALEQLPDLRFHFIGHLQRNKVQKLGALVSAIHSVDSVRLVSELDRRLEGMPLPAARRLDPAESRLPVFVEVNVGREPQKHGAMPDALAEILESVERSSSLVLRGLMTVPPHTEDPEGARPYFRELAALRKTHGAPRLPELSMGMTHDFVQAIEEGATSIRIGTKLFGERVA